MLFIPIPIHHSAEAAIQPGMLPMMLEVVSGWNKGQPVKEKRLVNVWGFVDVKPWVNDDAPHDRYVEIRFGSDRSDVYPVVGTVEEFARALGRT
jgi:hypothetical protein